MVNRIRTSFAIALVAVAALVLQPGSAAAQSTGYAFYAVTPCRAVDTRIGYGGVMTLGSTRTFTMKGVCGVPTDAKAVSLNVTMTQPTMTGRAWLSLYPTGTTPVFTTLIFADTDASISNGAIVPISEAATEDLSALTLLKPGTVHMLLDVTGYFK